MPDQGKPNDRGRAPGSAPPPLRWTLELAATGLLIAGWLLPWFVEPGANGIGRSPQQAIGVAGGTPAGVALELMALSLLGVLAAVIYQIACRLVRRRARAGIAVIAGGLSAVGATATLAVWFEVAGRHAAGGFGELTPDTLTDGAVWMTLAGFLFAAVTFAAAGSIDRHPGIAFAMVAFAFGGAFPVMFHQATDFVSWGAQSAGIYVLLALGLNVVVGFAGLLDLGYAAFYAIGAYTTASFASSAHGIHLPFWILIFLGAAVAALFGAILGAPTLRLRGDYLAIVTLGFGEIVPDLATNNIFGLTGGPNGLSGIDSPSFPTHGTALYDFGQVGSNPAPYFYALLALILITVAGLRNLERSRIGRAWMAIREDEVAAAATGVNPISTKLLAFAIGASVSGLAGAFFGAMLGSVTPETFQFQVSVTALSTVVLGGIGSLGGVTVGAILVAFVIFWVLPHLQSWLGTVSGTIHAPGLATIDYTQYKLIVYGVVLVGIMLIRPAGLFPSRARRIELTGPATESLAAVQGTV